MNDQEMFWASEPDLYKLPDGEVTDDQAEYTAAWYTLGKKLATALGGVLASFDPHVTIRFPDRVYCPQEAFSPETAKRIVELYEEVQ